MIKTIITILILGILVGCACCKKGQKLNEHKQSISYQTSGCMTGCDAVQFAISGNGDVAWQSKNDRMQITEKAFTLSKKENCEFWDSVLSEDWSTIQLHQNGEGDTQLKQIAMSHSNGDYAFQYVIASNNSIRNLETRIENIINQYTQ